MPKAAPNPRFIRERILLIDDFAFVRTTLGEHLKEMGVSEILEAEDGESARRLLEEAVAVGRPVSAVFCDWNMPGGGGEEFIRFCRASLEFKYLPIILLTAESEHERLMRALSSGANDYILKPFTHELVARKLERVLARATNSQQAG